MNDSNIFDNYSNEEIAKIIYDDFIQDKTLTNENVRKKFKDFEEDFWSKHHIGVEMLTPELEERQLDIYDIVWFKIIELEKELVLKRNKLLNTKSDEEIAELFFNKIKEQEDISSINLSIYYEEIGIGDIFMLPPSARQRIQKIFNMVWQKVKELKNQRKHERIERERKESFKLIEEIIDWVKEKGLKKLSKINLKLYLSEKKMNLAPVNRQALYLEVNKQIESKIEKKK